MPRRPVNLHCSTQDRAQLETWMRGQAQEARLVLRAKIIVQGLNGFTGKEIAANLGVRPNTVSQWLRRFSEKGIAALHDRPRPGKPRQYDLDFRHKILTVLERTPPSGQAQWDGAAVARELGASPDAVWRVLRKEGIYLQRQRSWCVSTDPEFTAKAADIIGLYLNPPENALVLSLDEKPGIQALERATGDVKTNSGKIARGYKSTYKRHGTLNLFAALEVATGAIHAKTTTLKRRVEFLEFMDEVVNDLPPTREIHMILDNLCTHKKNDVWLSAHPNVFFHFTPTSASWLNLVEVWFCLLTRKALRGGSFSGTAALQKAIEDFIAAYTPNAKPFVWRKREVAGAQLKNNIVNLCN